MAATQACAKFVYGITTSTQGEIMTIPKHLPAELLDSLVSDYKSPEDLIGEHGYAAYHAQ